MTNHAEEISQLSLSLLHTLRDMARNDPAEAALYFGVGDDVVEAIAECGPAELQALARPGLMLFAPRIKASQIRNLCQSKGSSAERRRTAAMALVK